MWNYATAAATVNALLDIKKNCFILSAMSGFGDTKDYRQNENKLNAIVCKKSK